jgi:hypothetical protein
MTDIIKRLRENNPDKPTTDRFEAADEIERMRIALQDVASTLDWACHGSMEGRLRKVAEAALKPTLEGELELIIANLRHAYAQLAAGTVRLQNQKEFADGLIAPQIRKLEKMVNEGNDPCTATTRHIFPNA